MTAQILTPEWSYTYCRGTAVVYPYEVGMVVSVRGQYFAICMVGGFGSFKYALSACRLSACRLSGAAPPSIFHTDSYIHMVRRYHVYISDVTLRLGQPSESGTYI